MTQIWRCFVMITAAVITLNSSWGAPTWEKGLLFKKQPVYRTRLANGLRLVVSPDLSSTAAVEVWYDVGSRDDPKTFTGMAHFFEHLMFKKTAHYPEGAFDRLLDEGGAEDINAFTSSDVTAYTLEIPPASLDLILKLEAERMQHLTLDLAHLESERDVVHNERRFRDENNPDGLLSQTLLSLAYTQHPYGVPIIGYPEDLNRITVDEALKFYRRHYQPSQAVLLVSGGVKPDDVHARVAKYFGSMSQAGTPSTEVPRPALAVEPKLTETRRKTFPLQSTLTKMALAFPIPQASHVDFPALMLLDFMLGSGRASMLGEALVDSGRVTQLDVEAGEQKDPSLFAIVMSLQKNQKPEEVEAALFRELEKIQSTDFPNAALTRAKRVLEHALSDGLASNPDRSHWLGKSELLFGHWKHGQAVVQAALKLDLKTLRSVARRYFSRDKALVVTGVGS